ncbi:AAA family ATPase [Mammaliicoccus lentus]|uniref:AAA family ATPase n=1 Tax=Mammaliicoccus lentus TaxID=42858 RepID=UPI001071C5B9|nr:AAA family ATPase [Mammaliicoccus lentus]MBF0748738.1 AAA family ATPase [Mammaliicoccus lentus]TFU58725.1 adenylyl-sulfate kinase [Mammaliicoccus lentus]
MIIWLNGAYGSGKTTVAYELQKRLKKSFIYDPENVGFFIRKNTPKELHKHNFQDHEQWRNFNYEMLKQIANSYDGIIIVPMTLINFDYYREIVEKLKSDGIHLDHYVLYADKNTILRRLNKRLEFGNTFAKSQIDYCIKAFNTKIKDNKIVTDKLNVDDIVVEISKRSDLNLLKDNRNFLRKRIDKILTTIKHIR